MNTLQKKFRDQRNTRKIALSQIFPFGHDPNKVYVAFGEQFQKDAINNLNKRFVDAQNNKQIIKAKSAQEVLDNCGSIYKHSTQ